MLRFKAESPEYENFGRAMAQTVSHRLLAAEARVQSKVSPRGVSGGQIVAGRGFPPSTSPVPRQYKFTNPPYSLIYHQATIMLPL